MQFFLKMAVLLIFTIACGSVLAEACTYREAIMAFEQGNNVRGTALMRMANKDGDKRASDYLVMKGYQYETETADYPSQKSLISLNQVDP